jgi:hypothetical protein
MSVLRCKKGEWNPTKRSVELLVSDGGFHHAPEDRACAPPELWATRNPTASLSVRDLTIAESIFSIEPRFVGHLRRGP